MVYEVGLYWMETLVQINIDGIMESRIEVYLNT